MRSISIKNLMIQFDADQVTAGEPLKQAHEAVAMINSLLACNSNGLCAQITESAIDNDDIEVNDSENDDPEWDVQIRATVVKTERVQAATEQEAIEAAHAQFSVGDADSPEKYDEETLNCKRVQP